MNIVDKGGNYGWNVREGRSCFQAEDCPTTAPNGENALDPAIQYPHNGDGITGVSVIGGYIYDGENSPAPEGRYVLTGYVAQGQLYVAPEDDDG